MIELRDYQKQGVAWLKDKGRVMLADDPGLGKTIQALSASEGRTLILAPAMIHDGKTWEKDIAKLGLDPDRFTMGGYTSLCDRESSVQPDCACRVDKRKHNEWRAPQLYSGKCKRITAKVVERPRPEFKGPWDTIICDEAHYLKGRNTTWTKVLRRLARDVPNVYLLTGTPISNFAPELFAPLQILYPEQAAPGGKFGSYWKWVGKWFDVQASPFGGDHSKTIGGLSLCDPECLALPAWEPCEHYKWFYDKNLGERYFKRLREDVLGDLPPMTEVTIECPMTAKQAKEYARMKKDCLAQDLDGNLMVAWTKSAAHLRCDQIATGLGIFSSDDIRESGKLDRLRFDLENRDRPTLVVAHYRNTVSACAKVAKDLGLTVSQIDGGVAKDARGQLVDDFQDGKLDVLVGSLETISEGLTLTAADMVIFVEKSWKPSRNEQALRRIHRIGQTRPCTAYDYVTPASVDVGKRELLAAKNDQQMRTLSWGVVRDLL